MEFTREGLQENGFAGFVGLNESEPGDVPQAPGVYVAYRLSTADPVFLPRNGAGLRDRMVSVDVLADNWVDGVQVLYIGRTGSLCRRIDQFRRFGAGIADNHVGGCLRLSAG